MLKTRICLVGFTLMWMAALWIASATVGARAASIASIQNIRYWPTSIHTRVVIDLDQDAQYVNERLTNPDRIYFDISNARLGSDLLNRTIQAGDDFLKRIRVAQNRPGVVRVVFNISSVSDYTVSELHNPFRIVLDLHSQPRAKRELDSPQQVSNARPYEVESSVTAMPARPAGQTAQDAQVSLGYSEADKIAASPVPIKTEAKSEPSPMEEIEPFPSSTPAIFTTTQPRPLGPAVAKTAKPPAKVKGQEAPLADLGMPLTMNGTVSTGYYSAYTRGGGNDNQSISFFPATAAFDIHGFYLTPDLVDYSIQPEFNVGPQANDAGFQGGNGIRMNITAFRRQIVPLTFRYSNVQLQDVYFGSLSQISSYTLKNRDKELGLTAALQRNGFPAVTLDWGTSSVQSQSFISEIPDYVSHSNHLNINYAYQRWGWDFQGFTGRQEQTSILFSPLAEGMGSYALRQEVTQYRASARRNFLRDSELYVDGGSQSTSNIMLNRPIDLTARYANASLRLFQRRKWKTSLRAGYTSNIAGLLLTRLVGGLGSTGSIAPNESILAPFQRTTSYLNLSGLTSVDLSHGFSVFGSADRTEVLAASDSQLSSKYLTTAGGLSYAGTFGWGNLSGQYGRSFGMGSVTGQAGRIDGQNYVLTVQPGKREGLQFDFSVRGTDQKVFNEHPANEHSLASEGSMGLRVLGQFRARLGGGWQQSTFTTTGNDFHTKGYTAQASLEHSRFQFSGSLNSMVGNSLQAYDQLFSGIGVGSALLTPLHMIPSDFRGVTLTLHVIPIRKLELSALWTRSVQHLEGIVANDFEVIDVSLTYHFRKLQIIGGFFSSAQSYANSLATFPRTERGRFYIRISRTGRFL